MASGKLLSPLQNVGFNLFDIQWPNKATRLSGANSFELASILTKNCFQF